MKSSKQQDRLDCHIMSIFLQLLDKTKQEFLLLFSENQNENENVQSDLKSV